MSAQLGLLTLVKTLLTEGANPNCQTLYVEPPPNPSKHSVSRPLLPSTHNATASEHLHNNMSSVSADSTVMPGNLLLSMNATAQEYNPFVLDEADNPFTEENDPSNPFADDTDKRKSPARQYGYDDSELVIGVVVYLFFV